MFSGLCNKIDLDVFKSFNEEEQLSFIRIWFNKYIKTHSYSKSYLLQMVDILKSDKNIETKDQHRKVGNHRTIRD